MEQIKEKVVTKNEGGACGIVYTESARHDKRELSRTELNISAALMMILVIMKETRTVLLIDTGVLVPDLEAH